MSERKKSLTLKDHTRIGVELHVIRARLLALGTEIANSMPKASPAAKAALRMADGIDRARCQLDSIACRMPGGNSFVYYPGVPRVVDDFDEIGF